MLVLAGRYADCLKSHCSGALCQRTACGGACVKAQGVLWISVDITLRSMWVLSRVGDMFKFGRSTRMYILGGPTELMPEEGLTKKQMLAMKALEVRQPWHARNIPGILIEQHLRLNCHRGRQAQHCQTACAAGCSVCVGLGNLFA